MWLLMPIVFTLPILNHKSYRLKAVDKKGVSWSMTLLKWALLMNRKARKKMKEVTEQLAIALLEWEEKEKSNNIKKHKEKVNSAKLNCLWTKKGCQAKSWKGKPEASIVAETELYLESLNITKATYHGGNFNGVCWRRLVASPDNVTKTTKEKLIAKKDTLLQKHVREAHFYYCTHHYSTTKALKPALPFLLVVI